jgi:hypothetical protein
LENTEKKNQHYIPKFLLRYFSYQDNQNQIGVYYKKGKYFKQDSKLKTQASKKFFYGKDGLIEDWLGEIESIVAPIFSKIKNEQILPKHMLTDQVDMLFFLILLDLRNPNRKTHFQNSTKLIKEHLLSKGADKNSDIIKQIEDSEKQDVSFQRMIIKSRRLISHCMDLKYKLIRNTSQKPFITSDNPLVKYNQFLEKRKWQQGSHNGFGSLGAQWMIPLNAEYLLLFYDENIYKVGNKKEKIVEINDVKSIDQLNILQYLNSINNIFFNHKTQKEYAEYIANSASKYQKPNESYKEVYTPEKSDKENEELIFLGITDLKINLSIQKVNMHSKSQRLKLDDKIVQLRPKVIEVREYERKKTMPNTFSGKTKL